LKKKEKDDEATRDGDDDRRRRSRGARALATAARGWFLFCRPLLLREDCDPQADESCVALLSAGG
jgi:hypothetical protein